jgi:hypothetical protein
MRKRRVKPLKYKYIICTMWNKMKLAAQIRIALRGEREREREKNGAPKSHALMSGSLVAKPKSGPDYYHEIIYLFSF